MRARVHSLLAMYVEVVHIISRTLLVLEKPFGIFKTGSLSVGHTASLCGWGVQPITARRKLSLRTWKQEGYGAARCRDQA